MSDGDWASPDNFVRSVASCDLRAKLWLKQFVGT